MLVRDIWSECVESIGSCDAALIYRTLTRAIELLAVKALCDPLIGTIDFVVDGAYYIALPRDVKTPIRLNINNNPSFSRTRIYEFSMNSPGSVDGAEVGWQWHERGYSCIQDELKLPSVLSYEVDAADEGKTLRVRGIDPDGYERDETLIGAASSPVASVNIFAEVRSVVREATTVEAYLMAATGPIARYYPDEEQPEYRVIKLSQTGVAVRMVYRKHVFKITSQDDIIPLHSAMAVIRAVDAVRLMAQKKYEDAKLVMEEAAGMLGQEQASRDEAETLAGSMELQSATNTNINTNGVLIVADIYDSAAEILGPIGRAKLFDRITDAINALANKTQWESMLGWCDLYRYHDAASGTKDGFFVLPREVGAVLAVNYDGRPTIPRNRWFEYHLNGTGETRFSSCGTWDSATPSPIVNPIPHVNRSVTPTRVFAVPVNALDEDAVIRIFGVERLENGNEAKVFRDGEEGWLCPCKMTDRDIDEDSPKFVEIHRIEKALTTDFVSFYTVIESGTGSSITGTPNLILGYWYPDERAPMYQVIKITGCCRTRIRIRYRKATNKISSLYDVINLRSRLALENMLRALANHATDPQKAVAYEEMAVNYLAEEQSAMNPIRAGGLQFDPGTCPAVTENIQ